LGSDDEMDKELRSFGTYREEGKANDMLDTEFLGEDRLRFLVQATKEDIMTFLTWVLDVYPRVRKRSSLDEYWRLWCMLYRKSVGRSLHA